MADGTASAWWTREVESRLSPYTIYVLGTFLVHELAWVAFNVPYMLADRYGWWAKHKITRRKLSKTAERRHTPEAQLSEFKRLALGHITQMLPMLLLSGPLLLALGFRTSWEDVPTWGTFALQFLVFNVIEDTGFYWVHRYMHTPHMFKRFHYIHHKYDPPFSLAGEIMHPVEFVFNVLLPMFTGPILFAALGGGCHVFTVWTWATFRELRGTDAHSDYCLPWHPLRLLSGIYGGPAYHTIHHRAPTKNSNYGGYLVWDWLMSTAIKPSA